MIDNRPKRRRAQKQHDITAIEPEPAQTVEIHNHPASTPADPSKAPAPKAKASPANPLAGLGATLGNMGPLPLALAAGAMQKGRGQPSARASAAQPFPDVKSERDISVKAATAPQVAMAQTGRKPHSLREVQTPPISDTTIQQAVPAAQPRPARIARPGPKPHEIRGLLNDLSGYLPGSGGASVARVGKIMGIADELRNINNTGVFTTSAPANPMDRSIGLLNVLSRNMQTGSASSLGRATQVLSLVNTLKGAGSGQGLGGLGALGGLGNIGSMAGMLGGMMNQQPTAAPAQQIKNVTPAQADGIKDTVNRLLSGMDDKKKAELLDRAKDFLNQSKN